MTLWRRMLVFGAVVLVGLVIYVAAAGSGTSRLPADGYMLPSRAEIAARQHQCISNGVKFRAQSALVIDNKAGEWLFARNPQQVQSVASLTKLLTTMVYLDTRPNLNQNITISSQDCFESSRSRVFEKETFRAMDLLHIALMASDNRATRALAGSTGLTIGEFIGRMNAKARSLGMMNTTMYEVTGLDERNVSTAADIAVLINEAMKYQLIRACMEEYKYVCRPLNKRRQRTFTNTNRLLLSKWQVLAGKTGYINESDYCLATILSETDGRQITVVILGAPTNGSRFTAARRLADFGFKETARAGHGTKQIAG